MNLNYILSIQCLKHLMVKGAWSGKVNIVNVAHREHHYQITFLIRHIKYENEKEEKKSK